MSHFRPDLEPDHGCHRQYRPSGSLSSHPPVSPPAVSPAVSPARSGATTDDSHELPANGSRLTITNCSPLTIPVCCHRVQCLGTVHGMDASVTSDLFLSLPGYLTPPRSSPSLSRVIPSPPGSQTPSMTCGRRFGSTTPGPQLAGSHGRFSHDHERRGHSAAARGAIPVSRRKSRDGPVAETTIGHAMELKQ